MTGKDTATDQPQALLAQERARRASLGLVALPWSAVRPGGREA